MGLVRVFNCYEPSEATVMFSKLTAAGLNPYIQNYHQIYMQYLNGVAYGGFNILIPEEESQMALEIVQEKYPLEDFDPIQSRAARTFMQTLFAFGTFYGFPLVIALFVTIFVYNGQANSGLKSVIGVIASLALPVLLICYHSSCIALPDLKSKRMTHEH